jgi:phosphoribosyl 1,2-cyclic phosphate phosphodiesterase
MTVAKGTFTIYGTGGSCGTPVIGCSCNICLSDNPKNKRLRTCAMLSCMGKHVLVDIGPDFRFQAIKHKVMKVDGLILTHIHYDHIAGLDELRIFNFRQKQPIPCLLSSDSLAGIKTRFNYIFDKQSESKTVQIDPIELKQDYGEIQFVDLPITYVSYYQTGMKVTGIRIGDLAFISDIKEFSPDIYPYLKDVKNVVIGAIRAHPSSKAHLSFEEAIEFSKVIGAEKTYLTHLCHSVDYIKDSEKLPENVFIAYDGLKINFSLDGA